MVLCSISIDENNIILFGYRNEKRSNKTHLLQNKLEAIRTSGKCEVSISTRNSIMKTSNCSSGLGLCVFVVAVVWWKQVSTSGCSRLVTCEVVSH